VAKMLQWWQVFFEVSKVDEMREFVQPRPKRTRLMREASQGITRTDCRHLNVHLLFFYNGPVGTWLPADPA